VATAAAAIACLVAVRADAAGFTPVSQDRSISATMTGRVSIWFPSSNPFFPDFDPPDQVNDTPNGPVVSSAVGFDGFDDTIVVSDTIAGIDGSATISQDSAITPTLIRASGSHDVQLDGANGQEFGNYVVRSNVFDSSSSFSATFSVSEDTSYSLDATLTRSLEWAVEPVGTLPHVNADVFVALVGPGGVVSSAMAPEASTCPPDDCAEAQIDVEGVLSPGTYTLTVYASGEGYSDCLDVGPGVTCFNAVGTASYDVLLSTGVAAPVPSLGAFGSLVLACMLGLAAWTRLHRASPGSTS
jgi:hypothetical protein